MHALQDLETVQEMNLLVGLFDLTRFFPYARNRPPREVFDLLYDYYEFVGDVIEGSGGTVVKFMGDAALIVYPENRVSDGVLALKALKAEGDVWLRKRQVACQNVITMHFGPVMCGPIGTKSEKRFDVFGSTVNTAATLPSNGLAMTAQVFRQLDSDTRKLFKKHTPPITYIPIEESHQD